MDDQKTDLAAPPLDLLRGASLFLDFDGTLVELAERPDAVQVATGTVELLSRLEAKLAGRVAVVSGRAVADVRRLLATDLAVVGSHGMEFSRADGSTELAERPAELEEVAAAMHDLAAREPDLLVEAKPLGVALHFRQNPCAEERCVALAKKYADQHGLQLQPGKMMVEVRAGGGDKGTAIGALMREPAMAGMRPVFMGDDHTDEPGFAVAAQLGGAGILIGHQRETAALYRLAGVEAALAWLEAASANAG